MAIAERERTTCGVGEDEYKSAIALLSPNVSLLVNRTGSMADKISRGLVERSYRIAFNKLDLDGLMITIGVLTSDTSSEYLTELTSKLWGLSPRRKMVLLYQENGIDIEDRISRIAAHQERLAIFRYEDSLPEPTKLTDAMTKLYESEKYF